MTTRRHLAAVCAAALAALVAAPGASAHAVLIGTTPGNDSVLERSPEIVALGLGAAGLIAGLAALGMGFRRRRQ